MDTEQRWYVIQTKPNCEDQALAWLQRRTHAALLLPRLELVRKQRGRKVRVIEPLFRSYLFARLSLYPEQWDAVNWTPGVRKILTCGDIPVPVPDETIALLESRSTGGVIRWQTHLTPGTPVRITSGPFAGLVGILDRPTSRADRVRILLQMMRTLAAVDVDLIDLEVTTEDPQLRRSTPPLRRPSA